MDLKPYYVYEIIFVTMSWGELIEIQVFPIPACYMLISIGFPDKSKVHFWNSLRWLMVCLNSWTGSSSNLTGPSVTSGCISPFIGCAEYGFNFKDLISVLARVSHKYLIIYTPGLHHKVSPKCLVDNESMPSALFWSPVLKVWILYKHYW